MKLSISQIRGAESLKINASQDFLRLRSHSFTRREYKHRKIFGGQLEIFA